ncbi:MAG TPA: NAD(P)-dependent oxidoreductase [Baekduia sp.]|uniref:NAD-dependent epimerase/dehydratase family protein n=1 Tax=Baekduia sp. TaxID=2600305 RepID=UPI002D780C88|nr:NAD(P)-dependent oxidoreductase [Baekduia sp.]HET6509700.1 NAD(P)-dependent oxidoreductase [Baekduia sp.]
MADRDRVLVTGGRGYVGRWIVRQLVDAGRPVVTYDRDWWPGEPGVIAAHGELQDATRLARVIEEQRVGKIIHTASISHPDVSVEMPVATIHANAMGTVELYEAARLAGVERVVNYSSSSIYGFQDGIVSEEAVLDPTTPYGVSKVVGDLLGKVYRGLYGFDVLSLRVHWVYGPGQRMQEYTHDLVRAALDGRPFRLQQGADHPLPMVFVRDVAAAGILAADAPAAQVTQAAYNVAGPEWPSLGELAERVAALVPGADLHVGPGDLPLDQLGDHRVAAVDLQAAARDLGYRPAWDLERGLAEYAEWLRVNEY